MCRITNPLVGKYESPGWKCFGFPDERMISWITSRIGPVDTKPDSDVFATSSYCLEVVILIHAFLITQSWGKRFREIGQICGWFPKVDLRSCFPYCQIFHVWGLSIPEVYFPETCALGDWNPKGVSVSKKWIWEWKATWTIPTSFFAMCDTWPFMRVWES